jgi:hypothetical protein
LLTRTGWFAEAKAVVFQFEKPGWVVEGRQRSSELGWYDRWQHAYIESALG